MDARGNICARLALLQDGICQFSLNEASMSVENSEFHQLAMAEAQLKSKVPQIKIDYNKNSTWLYEFIRQVFHQEIDAKYMQMDIHEKSIKHFAFGDVEVSVLNLDLGIHRFTFVPTDITAQEPNIFSFDLRHSLPDAEDAELADPGKIFTTAIETQSWQVRRQGLVPVSEAPLDPQTLRSMIADAALSVSKKIRFSNGFDEKTASTF